MHKSKIALIVTVVALCCFIFAGTALAKDNEIAVYADGKNFAYTGCTNDYTFEIINIETINADCFNNAQGSDIFISVTLDGAPASGITIDDGYSLPVKIYVVDSAGNGEWYFAQPTVVIENNTVRLHIEDLQIPDAASKYIDKIFIGDELQNLIITNPCQHDEYCVNITVETKCGNVDFSKSFEIKSAPYESTLIHVKCMKTQIACRDNLEVEGYVYDCGQNGVGNWPLGVFVDGQKMATGVTDATGYYKVSFDINLPPGEYTVEVVPEPVCADASVSHEFEVKKNIATHMAISVTDFDGVYDQLRYNKCNYVTVSLLDDCVYDATVAESVYIYLSATIPGNPPMVAGHFYPDCPDNGEINEEGRNENQINVLTIDPGDSTATVVLIPLVEGDITIKATARVGNITLMSDEIVVPSIAPGLVDLELVPLVTDDNGNPRAGWPIAAAVRLDYSASEDYSVTFTLNGADISFGDNPQQDFEAAFEVYGDNDADNPGKYPYCQKKWYFLLYPDSGLRGTAEITVNVNGVGSDTVVPDWSFVSPIELERSLLPDAWQTFSTPKLLAAPGAETPAFGTFEDLLDEIYAEINSNEIFVLGYRNGSWYFPGDEEIVEPLSGYFIRTPQREDAGRAPFVLQYVFARATDPSYALPYYYYSDAGDADSGYLDSTEWNSIGVGVNPELENTNTRQSDTAAHAYAALLKGNGSYLIWNPGSKLANVNDDFVSNALGGSVFPNTTYDAFTPMYNGDVYWLYGYCGNQYYSTNVGLDIIEWIGSFYDTYMESY